jgi:hypothetical protein
MRRLIAVWFVTPRREVLLKPKKIGKKEFLLPLEAWQRRGESDIGTLRRILEEIEPIAPPQKFHITVRRYREEEINTKFGEGKRVHYISDLPFQPIISENSDKILVDREKIKELKTRLLKEDYFTLLEILGIQPILTDFS